MTPAGQPHVDTPRRPAEALKKAEEYVEQEEGALNKLRGALGTFVTAVAVIMSLFHLYAAYGIMPTHVLRGIHVAFVLFLCFLLYPVAKRFRHRVHWWDWLAALVSLVIIGYMLAGGDAFLERAIAPMSWDEMLGIALIVLVLEAARRSAGWIMPAICVGFLVYAMVGQWLPPPWTHYGMDVSRIVGHMYMTLEGIFGIPIDVSSSLIILFTIYGAVLQFSGAGKFFIDFSFAAMGGKPTGAGRTVVLASFLLGGPSGSGVATTVTLGTVAYPMLMKAGYGRDAAGGLLAAGGLGAILSPPVLGAAAFLIAQFLNISYLDVILMATIPTLLYYFALFLMVEIDARKFGMPAVVIEEHATVGALTRQYWFHFLSLIAIIVFMVIGFSPTTAVFWTIVAAVVLQLPACRLRADSVRRAARQGAARARAVEFRARQGARGGFGRRAERRGDVRRRRTDRGRGDAHRAGTRSSARSCCSTPMAAVAAIYDGLVALGAAATPGLLHDIKLLLTAIFTSLIVWIVGLAVPVTASYIICAVIAAPALIALGVANFAAHMFIFYYAVLSEVSPPTALSPFAAAAITGGDPYKTTLQSWKYTMPAFLVPFMFVLDPAGLGLAADGLVQEARGRATGSTLRSSASPR